MSKKENLLRLLYSIFLLMVSAVVVQKEFSIVKMDTLNGYQESTGEGDFTWASWFNGEYQDHQEKYLTDHLGFRSWFIKVNNQIGYSLFSEARANGVIIGKGEYLFEEGYIHTYLGEDYIGEEAIREKVHKLRMVQDTLKSIGVDLCVVLAPGKASFYPEYIPDSYEQYSGKPTNYEGYVRELHIQGIKTLDAHAWFKSMKNTSSYPLFPKCGIHWSHYGELLVADSMLRFISSLRGVKLAHIELGDVEMSTSARYNDNDIEKGMNLLYNIPTYPLAYPAFSIKKDSGAVSLKVLTIADSFYWGMFNWGISVHAFDQSKFWFYNEAIYPDSYESPLTVNDVDVQAEVEKNEVILLMCADVNLKRFAFGFIDQLFEVYYPHESLEK